MKSKVIWGILAVLVLGGGVAAWMRFGANVPGADAPGGLACTQEARLCPDGTYVGRTRPGCEFAQCSSESWKSTTDGRVMFNYPADIGTNYITTVDWPPKFQVVDQAFVCNEAGSPGDRAGETARVSAEGREYCMTRVVEGAAGSIYTQYAYAFPKDGKTLLLTFSTRAPQCANYEEVKKKKCEEEVLAFDPTRLADRIAITAEWK